VAIFLVPIVEELASWKLSKRAERLKQMALERFRRRGWIEMRSAFGFRHNHIYDA